MLAVSRIQAVIKEKVEGVLKPEHTATAHYYRHLPTGCLYSSVTAKTSILDSPHLKKWAASTTAEYIKKNFHKVTPENIDDVLKAATMSHVDIFEDAGGVGTLGHNVIDRYMSEWMKTGIKPKDIRSFVYEQDYRVFAIARSMEQFAIDFDAIPVASELLVASIKYGYAGTLDSLFMIPRKYQTNLCDHEWVSNPLKDNVDICWKCKTEKVYDLVLVDWKTSNTADKKEYAMQTAAYFYAFKEMTGIAPKYIIILHLNKDQKKYDVLKVLSPLKSFQAFKNLAKVHAWLTDGDDKLQSLNKKVSVDLF